MSPHVAPTAEEDTAQNYLKKVEETMQQVEKRELNLMEAQKISPKALEGTFKVPRHPILFAKKYSMKQQILREDQTD